MKIYGEFGVSAKSLRTGLFAVCFLAVICAASGCGKTDILLSELREEDRTSLERSSETAESGDANEVTNVVAEENDVGSLETADTHADDAGIQNIYVHVCGAVKKPGVYVMPAGSRFYEAVEAAGGFAAGACEDYLNMAALLADGSRLEIPTSEEIQAKEEYPFYTLAEEKGAAPGGKDAAGGDASGGPVNINTADADGLCRLPGVGEGRAKAIIEYREKQGRFQKKEDIMQVSGIGEKMYERMEEYLTVE